MSQHPTRMSGKKRNVYAIISSGPPKGEHFIEFSKSFLPFSIHTKKKKFNRIRVILSIRNFKDL